MNSASQSLIAKILEVLPELEAAYREHIHDNDVLLPHVFMGDVTRYVAANVERLTLNGEIGKLLSEFEFQFEAGSEDVRELISVSFLENLQGEDQTIHILKPLMGPYLRREAAAALGK